MIAIIIFLLILFKFKLIEIFQNSVHTYHFAKILLKTFQLHWFINIPI